LDDSGLLQCDDEGQRGAVAAGHFGLVDPDLALSTCMPASAP